MEAIWDENSWEWMRMKTGISDNVEGVFKIYSNGGNQ